MVVVHYNAFLSASVSIILFTILLLYHIYYYNLLLCYIYYNSIILFRCEFLSCVHRNIYNAF